MPPKKKVSGLIKLQIQAGAANPAAARGPALGQHGVNIMEFCKAYNAATESQRGQVIPVEITVYEDRSSRSSPRPSGSQADPESSRSAEGLRQPAAAGRQDQQGAGQGDRRDEDGRLECQRRRRGHEHHRRYGALHGRHRHRLVVATTHRVGGSHRPR